MASKRLLQEVEIGDLPRIELGAFNWQPVEKPITPTSITPNQQPVRFPRHFKPADPLTSTEFPLNKLENKTFAGTGYNVVWRPRSEHPLLPKEKDPLKTGPPDPVPLGTELDVLQLNLTAETLAFSGNIGDVPNRGVGAQADLLLKGIPYVQRIGAFENDETGLDDNKNPPGIHFEPGVFMFVPKCDSNPPGHPATINRMASIPHGTTINAQGGINTDDIPGKPDFNKEKVSILPFAIRAADPVAAARSSLFKKQLNFSVDTDSNRLPAKLNKFSKTIPRAVFDNPNEVLRQAIDDQNIKSFVRLDLTTSLQGNPQRPKTSPEPIEVTKANANIVGGGTANIGFLQGTDDLTKAGDGLGNDKPTTGNAHAAKMTVTYWIETLTRTLTIQPKTGKEQVFPTDVSAAGVLGPTFVVSREESDKISSTVTKPVFWTQIQYSQNVTLNFNGLSWPHISVATLGDVSRIPITATLDKPASRVTSVL